MNWSLWSSVRHGNGNGLMEEGGGGGGGGGGEGVAGSAHDVTAALGCLFLFIIVFSVSRVAK